MFGKKYSSYYLNEKFALVKSAFAECDKECKRAQQMRIDERYSPYGKVSEETARGAENIVKEGYKLLAAKLKAIASDLEHIR